jgi:hypothetical protein
MSEKSRKIDLPYYCCPFDRQIIDGDKDCEHDYPPESKEEFDTFIRWVCSKCGMKTSYGVYQ